MFVFCSKILKGTDCIVLCEGISFSLTGVHGMGIFSQEAVLERCAHFPKIDKQKANRSFNSSGSLLHSFFREDCFIC